jgi:Tol biopolymer transport system component
MHPLTPAVTFAAAAFLTAFASVSEARILGDGKGRAESDCFIVLEPFDAGSIAPFGAKRLPSIQCTDCDPTCDHDGLASADGTCEFRVIACLNVDDGATATCMPAPLTKAKAVAKFKNGSVIDFSPPLPADASATCGSEASVPVAVKTRPDGNRPGTAQLTLLATAEGRPRDRDRLLLVCAPRPSGQACPTVPAIPAAPSHVRVAQSPGGPPIFRLRWNADDPSAPVETFLVHEAAARFDDIGDATLLAAVPGTARAVDIALLAGTGIRHFRVTAVSADGLHSDPSPEFAVDTTPRIVFQADKTTNDVFELFSVVPGSDAEPTPLSGTLVADGDVDRFFLSPDGRHVAFSADKDIDGQLELFVAPLDGSSQPINVSASFVAGGAFQPFFFQFSPDGSRIAFVGDMLADERFELFVAPIDASSAPVPVSGSLADGGDVDVDEFSWSPDGRRLAFLADKVTDGVNELFVVDAAGGAEPLAVSSVLVEGGQVEGFAWSPDGARLAFRGSKETPGRQELFVTRPEGASEPEKVSGQLQDVAAVNSDPLWSPDSTRIAFAGDLVVNGIFEVFVTPAEAGGAPFRVSGVSQAFSDIVGFRWSPDGTRLAFNMDKNADNADEVFIATAAGGTEPIRVSGAFATDEEAFNVQWSPQSDRVAFFADDSVPAQFELFVANAGTVDSALPTSGVVDANEDVFQFAWSPDGSSLVIVADLETDGVSEVFVTPAVGGGRPVKVSGTMTPGGGASSLSVAFAPLGTTN